ncbi:DUF2975 domain-containing protein [Actinomadura atramentaria]|uniref:DUF2975 domain-containing protein n=1 Tax=Actinomadura atramentaria TaxID=1990 RepID=UPI000374B5CD|nr:DUF2975 domain-containing protein [Actinomadura atramentaria]
MTAKLGWSRGDNRLLEALLALAAVLVGVFGVLIPALGVVGAVGPIDTREVTLDTTTRPPSAAVQEATDHGMTLTGTHHADLAFTNPDLSQRLLLALPELVGGLFLLLVLFLLFKMAATLRTGDVFVPENARRLSIIGVTALAQAVLAPTLPALTTQVLVRGTSLADEIPFSVTFTGGYVLLAFLILALAEVFRRGTKLRADTEGLI